MLFFYLSAILPAELWSQIDAMSPASSAIPFHITRSEVTWRDPYYTSQREEAIPSLCLLLLDLVFYTRYSLWSAVTVASCLRFHECGWIIYVTKLCIVVQNAVDPIQVGKYKFKYSNTVMTNKFYLLPYSCQLILWFLTKHTKLKIVS